MTAVAGRAADAEEEPGGKMALSAHLRELRNRLGKSVLGVLVFGSLGVVFYEPIVEFLAEPFNNAAVNEGLNASINFNSITSPLIVPLKVGLLTGIAIGAPIWIYQLWAFVTPALYRRERRWAAAVILIASPLFLCGIALCLYLLPHALTAILGLTPENASNIVGIDDYIDILVRLAIAFGVAFLLPVFIVLLNALGVFTGSTLSTWRRWIVVGVFVFAAIATPTGDPFTLLGLGVPMYLLFEIAVVICRINDRRRSRSVGTDLDDDTATPVEDLDAID